MNSCTFIGHSECFDDIIDRLRIAIEDLIKNHNVTNFYVGTNGRFDYYAYKVLCELEKTYDINTVVVLSYINKNTAVDPYFSKDKTLFPAVLEKTPFRFAVSKRNYYMISQSEYLICYLNQTFTNSYLFVKKAIHKNLTVINLGSYDLSKI